MRRVMLTAFTVLEMCVRYPGDLDAACVRFHPDARDVCPRLERVQFAFLGIPMAEITSIRDRIKGLDARREALWGYL